MKKLDNSEKDILISIVSTLVLILLITVASCTSNTNIDELDKESIQNTSIDSFFGRTGDLKWLVYDFNADSRLK